MPRRLLITCEVFHRELLAAVARSPHQVDVVELPKGLHDRGGKAMAVGLQREIDRLDDAKYDALVLGYALCNNGLIGLTARTRPLVALRAHDCIACLLGSRERYDGEFAREPGTYWLSLGWIERGDAETATGPAITGPRDENPEWQRLLAKYGPENADFLWDELQQQIGRYTRLGFIDTGVGPQEEAAALAARKAAGKGWRFERMRGDPAWLERLVDGPWDDDRFIVVPPGKRMVARYDGTLVGIE